MTDMEFVEWPEWTPEKAARHAWLLEHIRTCRECELIREDNSSFECDAMRAHLDPAAVGGAP